MKTLLQGIRRFWNEEEGAVAIEYALLAVLIALAMAVGAGLLGDGLNLIFSNIAECFNAAGSSGTCPITM
ncbi:Flp/Fap pilin component [Azoarcus sp. Aa7]|nr:Flp/Fap pilin component [Azoarcus sp. Aa7]